MAVAAMKKVKATKAMKAKPMKVMKAKRVTKIAKGKLAKAMVFKGKKEKTVGGLRQEALMRNRRGKIVSKRASASGKRNFRYIEGWVDAVMAARSCFHTKGFVAINGKSLQGRALYYKAKALQAASMGAAQPSEAAEDVIQ
eukprot:TRINITY_DN56089_c0_g1_i1.p1 TRINITY_DN56089_c0_g1~~TRINITY_DN56089_c0_g1_i1.p1  ORF type:complete len:141 (+),score=40.42 TRINITY_DN56089_c0_g1_i1:77-499(+)